MKLKLAMVIAGLAFCCLSDGLGQSTAILPSQVLDLTNWKLTLPIGSPGSPTEILQPALNTFQDTYFNVNAAGNGVVFTCPAGGVTTSGSSYPRSELREMANNGTTQASWSSTLGTNTMEITEAITHLPVVKPQVIAGQIHDVVTKVIDCRLNGNELYIENASGGVDAVLTRSYQLGTAFTIKFVAANSGIAVYYNGNYVYTHSVRESGLYFKAGCYTQSNPSHGDLPTAYGQVIIYNLQLNTNSTVIAGVAANFLASTVSGLAPLTVQFTDQSTGPVVSWNWAFGDGTTSTNQNPLHTYAGAGNFTATLIVTGNSGQTDSASRIITATNISISPVTASFSVSPTSGLAPLAVQFTDRSTGPVVFWNWAFGDGATSTIQNPSHTYINAGMFTAQLTVIGSGGQAGSASRIITVANATNATQSQLGILAGAIASSPQNGLFEQPVTVTNSDSANVSAVRLAVGGLRSGVKLYNAWGTNAAGLPYAQYNAPLNPNQTVTFLLEFYVPDRGTFTDTIQVAAVAPVILPAVSGGFGINRVFLSSNGSAQPRVVVEFNSSPGRTYTVIYSDDNMATWQPAIPSIAASSIMTQWYDNGPPETVSRPVSLGSRVYRVIPGSVIP